MDRRKLVTIFGSILPIAPIVYEHTFTTVEQISRKENWFGNVTHDNESVTFEYEAFPNPIVRKINDTYKLRPKLTRTDSIFNSIDEPSHQFTISDTDSYYNINNKIKTSVLGFHFAFTHVKNDGKNKKLTNQVLPETISHEILAALRFTQKHEYRKDYNSTTATTYIRNPIETLITGIGDCKDKTLLFTALMNGLENETGYAVFKNHIAPIIRQKELPEKLHGKENVIINIQNKTYVIVESTSMHNIGELVKPRNELIMTYTKTITPFNIEQTPNHMQKALDILLKNNKTKTTT